MTDFAEITAQWAAKCARQAKANARNQAVIMDALAALGVTQLEVTFDGCGDSGQIEEIAVAGATDTLTGEVTVGSTSWNGPDQSENITLRDAVETLCYGLLEAEHDGWENNDGAFGSFTFDVETREIHLEFNGRYTSYETSDHTFTAET
jgi:hypothetical protein